MITRKNRASIAVVHIPFLLVIGLFLFLMDAFAGDPNSTPIPVLIENAKKALAGDDDKILEAALGRLFERITGFTDSPSQSAEEVPDDLYIEKMCEYAKVIEPILTPERLEAIRHDRAFQAFSVVWIGDENDVAVRAMTDCVSDDGRPLATSQFMRDGIAWAKAFQSADAEKALSMAHDIEVLVVGNPNNLALAMLSAMTRFHAKEKQRAERPKTEQDLRRELWGYRMDLVSQADKGDLSIQLEVARRIETGDKFRQDNRMAYFWYQRAFRNGGGDEAKAGMDRLYPLLTEDELGTIEYWTQKGHHPY